MNLTPPLVGLPWGAPGSGAPHAFALATAFTLAFSGAASAQPLLGFPVKGQNPYTAPITTVLDHSAADFYSPAHTGVLAYTGESAIGKPGAIAPYGYFHLGADDDNPVHFIVNGNYVGTTANRSAVLNYSGHAGYDYRYGPGTAIIAPADGTLYIPASDAIYGRAGDPWCALHAFYIDHGNGWSTWYLHADHLTLNGGRLADGKLPHVCDAWLQTRIDHDERVGVVKRGETVAIVGNFARGFAGGVGYHLHFEVRRDCIVSPQDGPSIHGCHVVDPYGWEWPAPDPFASQEADSSHNPLAASQSAPLWDLSALSTMLPEISHVAMSHTYKGYWLDIMGHNFAPGASISLWSSLGTQLVVTLNPMQLSDAHVRASIPDRLAHELGNLVVKLQNPRGPRSRGTALSATTSVYRLSSGTELLLGVVQFGRL